MLPSYQHQRGPLELDEAGLLAPQLYEDWFEWFHSSPIHRIGEANESQATMPSAMIVESRSFNPSVCFSVESLCIKDFMPCSSQFEENTCSTRLASHGWLPLAFSVTGKTLDGAAIGTLVVNSEVSHIVHSHLRDQPPLFEGVLSHKECSWVARGETIAWQRASSLSMSSTMEGSGRTVNGACCVT
jgi:hypothetical protein